MTGTGPFGDFEDAEFGDVVDGQVVGGVRPIGTARAGHINQVVGAQEQSQQAYLPPEMADKIVQLATDQRSRALALFVEVPLLAFVAFSPKVPALLRLGAAGVAVMRAVEVAQRQAELEAYLPELP